MDTQLCEQLGTFCRNPNFTGCYKKCPCSLSSNCSYYTDESNKTKRLKTKKYDYDFDAYYESEFKIDYSLPEVYTNG